MFFDFDFKNNFELNVSFDPSSSLNYVAIFHPPSDN